MAKRSPPPRKKSFGAIPRDYSGTMKKRIFVDRILRPLFGGSVARSLNPLRRKDVREMLGKKGDLSKLDPTAKGPKSKFPSRLTKKESEHIVDDVREEIRSGESALHEQGKFRGKDPEVIYKRTVEQLYGEEGKVEQEREAALNEQVQKARRRERTREEMGLSSIKKLTADAKSRREQFEERLGLVDPAKARLTSQVAPAKPGGVAGPMGQSQPGGQSRPSVPQGKTAGPVYKIFPGHPAAPISPNANHDAEEPDAPPAAQPKQENRAAGAPKEPPASKNEAGHDVPSAPRPVDQSGAAAPKSPAESTQGDEAADDETNQQSGSPNPGGDIEKNLPL